MFGAKKRQFRSDGFGAYSAGIIATTLPVAGSIFLTGEAAPSDPNRRCSSIARLYCVMALERSLAGRFFFRLVFANRAVIMRMLNSVKKQKRPRHRALSLRERRLREPIRKACRIQERPRANRSLSQAGHFSRVADQFESPCVGNRKSS